MGGWEKKSENERSLVGSPLTHQALVLDLALVNINCSLQSGSWWDQIPAGRTTSKLGCTHVHGSSIVSTLWNHINWFSFLSFVYL